MKSSSIVQYDTRDYPIEFLVSKFNKQECYIPNYHNCSKTHNLKQDKQFIESLLLGYPSQLIILAEHKNGMLEIVDGAERIGIIADFVNNRFSLNIGEFKKITYANLAIKKQQLFANKSLRTIVLSEYVDLKTKIEIYRRINTTLRGN